MRIGIFGNTNNYPLMLALGLRRLGHEAVLVVNRKERLHRPEAKYPELTAYPHWIRDYSDIPEEDFLTATPRIAPVLDFLAVGSGGLVLNDLGPSLLEFCRLPAVVLLTGSDLTYYADPAMRQMRQTGWSDDFAKTPSGRLWTRRFDEFVARQRAGIRAACAVSAPLPGLVPAMDALLRDIGVDDSRRDFLYLAETGNAPAPPNRTDRPLRVVNGARLNWKRPFPAGFSTQDHKATDILLHGFADFVAEGRDAELVMFRKGLHVAETEQLAASLGIASRIVWRDEVTLSEFYAEVSRADVVCDQLGESFPGMVAVDAMALGVPVIANFRPEILGRHFPEPIAACQASTPADVAAHLAMLAASPQARIKAGRAARHFARTHLSPAANAKRCLAHLGVGEPAPATKEAVHV
jgi:glycosyltransferase involved in cell wall biosynthesis